MGNILIFVQHSSNKLSKASLVALSAARELQKAWSQDKLYTLTLGKESAKAAQELLTYGVTQAFYSEDGRYEKYRADEYAAAVVELVKAHSISSIVAAATSTGKDLCPRVSAILDAGQASDIVAVNANGSLKRPMFAGNVFAEVTIESPLKVVTVRGTAFSAAKADGASVGSCVEYKPSHAESKSCEVISYEISSGGRPELSDAEIVVSGGRAMQSSENFQKYIFPLADALGAAVGASRAAVDSGYAPNDWQVGQTGKVVAPNLYMAIGISGAIQHLAGMKDSKVIVAVNKDPDAPIFDVADFGLVADLFEVLPKLTESIKKAKAGA